jgi:DNA-binding PadR family transcriptional regulator
MSAAATRERRTRENRTRYVVLGMLSAAPMTGYALRQQIAGSVGHFWQESYGQLYPTLRRLTDERLLEARAARGGPGRAGATYHVTARGRAVLAEWVSRPPAVESVRSELLLKVFFGGAVAPETTARNLEAAAARIRAQRAQLEGLAKRFEAQAGGHPDAPFRGLTIDFGLRFMHMALEWIDHAAGVVEEMRPGRRRACPAPFPAPAARKSARRPGGTP